MLSLAIMLGAVLAQLDSQPELKADPEAIRHGRKGVEYFTLITAPDGAVVRCGARLGDGTIIENPANCRHLQKLRSRPARDARGQPVYGMIRLAAQWMPLGVAAEAPGYDADLYLQLNRMPPGLSGTPATAMRVVIDKSGTADSCEVTHTSGDKRLDAAACAAAAKAAATDPVLDASGQPVRSVQMRVIGFVRRAD